MSNLASVGLPGSSGFPQNLRRVAVVNGSIAGALYGQAGDEAFRLEVVKLGSIVTKVTTSFAGGYGQLRQTFLSEEAKPGWCSGLFGIQYPCIKVRRIDLGFASPSYTASYDIAPGGAFNTFEIIRDEAPYEIFVPIAGPLVTTVYAHTFLSKKAHCFIPTKSALAFTGSNQDLAEPLNGRSLVCTGETPFHAYYAPTSNEAHVSLNASNVAWIMNELTGTPNINPAPAGLGSTNYSAVITTPTSDPICNTRVFNLALDPSIANDPTVIITWSAFPANLVGVLSGQNTNTATISRTSLNSGFATISATISFSTPGCKGAKTVDFPTWVGIPWVSASRKFYPRTINYCIGVDAPYMFPFFGGASSINAIFTDSNGSTNVTIPVLPDGGVAFTSYGTYVFISVSNNCGAFSYPIPNVISIEVIDTCSKVVAVKKLEKLTEQPTVNIFPNPSGGQVTVENILAGSKVDIYDNLGRVMLTSAASEGNSTNIDISSLKTGIYILEAILPNNQKVRKNIVRE